MRQLSGEEVDNTVDSSVDFNRWMHCVMVCDTSRHMDYHDLSCMCMRAAVHCRYSYTF